MSQCITTKPTTTGSIEACFIETRFDQSLRQFVESIRVHPQLLEEYRRVMVLFVREEDEGIDGGLELHEGLDAISHLLMEHRIPFPVQVNNGQGWNVGAAHRMCFDLRHIAL